jgi:hypothetical protein
MVLPSYWLNESSASKNNLQYRSGECLIGRDFNHPIGLPGRPDRG